MKYLVDYLRNNRQAVKQLHSFRHEGLAVSIISVAELHEGVFRASDLTQAERIVRNFLDEVSVLGIDENVSRVFGRERARLRRLGTPISDLDLLIASTALFHDLTLLTADSDFERVEELRIISPPK